MDFFERIEAFLRPRPLISPELTERNILQLPEDQQALIDRLAEKFSAGTITAKDIQQLAEIRAENGWRAYREAKEQVLPFGDILERREEAERRGPWVSQVLYSMASKNNADT